MSSRRTIVGRIIFLALLLGYLTGAKWQDEQVPTALQEVMQRVAAHAASTRRYREEKTLSILQHSLVSTGRLVYRPPDTFIREVDGNPPVRYVVSGSKLRVEKGGMSVRELQFGEHPLIDSLMDAFRAILTGDLPLLRRHFRLGFVGDPADWSLTLTPKENELARFLSRITITGKSWNVESIETTETGGDSSLMTLSPDDE